MSASPKALAARIEMERSYDRLRRVIDAGLEALRTEDRRFHDRLASARRAGEGA